MGLVSVLSSQRYFISLLIIIFGILLYLPTYELGYVGDDNIRIFLNRFLKDSNPLNAIVGQLSSRPLTLLTFWIEGKIFGLHPPLSRLINIILHYFTAYMMFLLIWRKSQNKTLAFYLALVFFVHAINSQAVIISIQRGAILATLFILCALYCALTSRFLLMVFSIILGVFSKEFAMLFVFPLLYFVVTDTTLTRFKKTFFSVLLLSTSFPLIHYSFLKESPYVSIYTTTQFLTTQISYFPTYLGKILYPFNLHYMYDFKYPTSFFEWKFLIGIGSIVCFFLSIAAFIKYINKNTLGYAFLFFLSILPEFSFFVIHHLFFEHRLYLPLCFFLIFVGIVNPIAFFKRRHHGVFVCLAVYLSSATLYRSFELSTNKKWEQNILKYPANDLGFHYEIIWKTLRQDDLTSAKAMLSQLKSYAPLDDQNLYVLDLIYQYAGDKNEKNLEKIGNAIIKNKKLKFTFRLYAVRYVSEEMLKYTTEERMSYLTATLVCPQLMYLSLVDTGLNEVETNFVKSCFLNADIYLQSSQSEEDKEDLIKILRKLVEHNRVILGPSSEKSIWKEIREKEGKQKNE